MKKNHKELKHFNLTKIRYYTSKYLEMFVCFYVYINKNWEVIYGELDKI